MIRKVLQEDYTNYKLIDNLSIKWWGGEGNLIFKDELIINISKK